jgi:hypothetical protein
MQHGDIERRCVVASDVAVFEQLVQAFGDLAECRLVRDIGIGDPVDEGDLRGDRTLWVDAPDAAGARPIHLDADDGDLYDSILGDVQACGLDVEYSEGSGELHGVFRPEYGVN